MPKTEAFQEFTGTPTPKALHFVIGNKGFPAPAWLAKPLPALVRERTGRALDFDHGPHWAVSPPSGILSTETGQDTVGVKGPFLEPRLHVSKPLRLLARDAPLCVRLLLSIRCRLNAEDANRFPETLLQRRAGLDKSCQRKCLRQGDINTTALHLHRKYCP